jgi:hypothetical protein
MIKQLTHELTGMFAGERRLSAAILAIVAVTAIMGQFSGVHRLAGGAALLFGCLGLLVASVCHAAHANVGKTGKTEAESSARRSG